MTTTEKPQWYAITVSVFKGWYNKAENLVTNVVEETHHYFGVPAEILSKIREEILENKSFIEYTDPYFLLKIPEVGAVKELRSDGSWEINGELQSTIQELLCDLFRGTAGKSKAPPSCQE